MKRAIALVAFRGVHAVGIETVSWHLDYLFLMFGHGRRVEGEGLGRIVTFFHRVFCFILALFILNGLGVGNCGLISRSGENTTREQPLGTMTGGKQRCMDCSLLFRAFLLITGAFSLGAVGDYLCV